MSLSDLINANLDKITRSEELDQNKIHLVENSEDEILNAVIEMENSLKDNWKIFSENKKLQLEFWKKLNYREIPENIYISDYFLKSNKDLMS